MRQIIKAIAFLAALLPSLAVAQTQLPTLPAGTVLGRLSSSSGTAQAIPFATLSAQMGKPHLVVYTVAPAGASAADKLRADFVGDGVNDQVAVNAAVTAARAISSYSKVVMLPGRYTFSNTANLGGGVGENGFVFEARGTFVNGPGVSATATAIDTFLIRNSNYSEFNFGSILTNNTGTAAAIHSIGNYSETKFTWQSLDGTARGGYGYFADTTSVATSQSVNWLTGTHVQNFDKGIVLAASGASSNIDTYRSTIDYIYNNNVGIYVRGSTGGSGHINANVWNVNIDCHAKNGDIALQTNGWYEVINATIGPVVTVDAGTCTNIQLDSGATSAILNLTPQNLAVTSGSIVNNSGNTNHLVNVGMPISLLAATDARGSIPIWDGGTRGQFAYSGIRFGSGIGTSQKQLYFSSAGVIGESKVAVTQPATGSTLTIDDGKTLRASNTITLAGTDGTTLTGPSTSATLARTDAAQTFTGTQTFSSTIAGSINGNAATASAAPASGLTGATLATGVTASSLTSAAGGNFAVGAFNTAGVNPVTLSGSGIYTVSANTKYIKIRLVGPGGGGSGSGTGAGAGGNGSVATTFSIRLGAVILTGNVGVGGGTSSNGGAGGTASGGNVMNITGGAGGSGPNGITTNFPGSAGAPSPFGAGGPGGNTGGAGFAAPSFGAGGGGGGEITTPNVGSGGGAGGYTEHIISNPSASYDYVVGTGGAAGTTGTGGAAGGAGAAGAIMIEEHFNY